MNLQSGNLKTKLFNDFFNQDNNKIYYLIFKIKLKPAIVPFKEQKKLHFLFDILENIFNL